MQHRLTIKDPVREQKIFSGRLLLSFVIVLICFSVLLARLIQLQVFQHKRYTTLSRQNRLELVPIAPLRGMIFDRHGKVLAKNMPSFNLEIIPDKTPDLPQTITELQKLFPLKCLGCNRLQVSVEGE